MDRRQHWRRQCYLDRAVRALHGGAGKDDAFLGWRLRERVAIRPDPAPYQEQLPQYFDAEHYGKLTPTYYQRSHEPQKEDHVGMDSRASMAGCGCFRVYRIRDRRYLNFAEFEKTAHYRRYYLEGGIHDRIMVGFPVTADCESFFLIDRSGRIRNPRCSACTRPHWWAMPCGGAPWLHLGERIRHREYRDLAARTYHEVLPDIVELLGGGDMLEGLSRQYRAELDETLNAYR